MKEDRGQEKRWYQKPEFWWMIFAFVVVQVIAAWKSSNETAAKGAAQAKAIEQLTKNFDDFQDKGFKQFQEEVRNRFTGIDKRQEDGQSETRRLWQQEHDSNGAVKALADQTAHELDEFKTDTKQRFSAIEELVRNSRERIGKLEVK